MWRHRALVAFLAVLLLAHGRFASAHPAPFTFLDVRVERDGLRLSLVAHVFDVAHDVGVAVPDDLLQTALLTEKGPAFAAVLAERVRLVADGEAVAVGPWKVIEALEDRQSIRLDAQASLAGAPGVIGLDARLFPYDPAHQTFVNFHENGRLTAQTILDAGRTTFRYYAGTVGGTWAMVRSLVPGGAMHILLGAEHLIMIVGLLLAGGSLRKMTLIATAFTVGHVLTLSLAVMNLITPPARLVDPAIALSMVYVGVDNLLVQDGRDVRAWIALAFGAIHGVGFASVLRGMELPRPALMLSLTSFHAGVELAQLALTIPIGLALIALSRRSERAGRRLATMGSIAVVVIGTLQFVQRVFFPGGV